MEVYRSWKKRHSGDFIDNEDNPDLANANADMRKDWERKHRKDYSLLAQRIRSKFKIMDNTASLRVGGSVRSARLNDSTIQTSGQVIREKTWLVGMITTLSKKFRGPTKPGSK